MQLTTLISIMVVASTFTFATMRSMASVTVLTMTKELEWNASTQGMYLSAFLYGSFLSLLPTGLLVKQYRSEYVMAVSIAGYAVSGLLIIPAAYCGEYALILVRAMMGAFMGMQFPAQTQLIATVIPAGSLVQLMGLNAVAGQVSTTLMCM